MSFKPPVGDATTTTKGIVRLAGDLGGTSTSPTVPGLISKVDTSDSRLTNTRVPADSSVTDAKVASNAAISLDKTTDGTDRLAMTANERTKLAGLAGTIYVTTTNATLPALDDGTVIARYSATVAASPVVNLVGSGTSTASSYTVTATTTLDIPAGDIIAVAVDRGITSAATTLGTAVVTTSAGATGTWTRASASRTGTHDTALLTSTVTSTIPSGSTITVTTSGNGNYRAGIVVAGIHNVSSATPDATSGDLAAGMAGDTSNGANGTGLTTLTATTSAATTVANTLVLAAFGIGYSATFTAGAGMTQIGQAYTTTGSADKGVLFEYKVLSAISTPSAAVNASVASGMAGVVLALPITMVEA